MLRVNLIPEQKKKGFELSSLDKDLLFAVGVVLIFFIGTYSYALGAKKTATVALSASLQEETRYATEKAAYYDNKALAQKTYDLEKYLDTGVAAQINENLILSDLAKYMLPATYLDKITFNATTGALVMSFRSVSFESLSLVFSQLLTDTKLVNAKIGGYTLPLKALNSTAAGTSGNSSAATMQITATWVMKKSVIVTTPTAKAAGTTVTNADGTTTTTNADGTTTTTNIDGTTTTTTTKKPVVTPVGGTP